MFLLLIDGYISNTSYLFG